MKRAVKITAALAVMIVSLAAGAGWWYLVPDFPEPPALPGTMSTHVLVHDGSTRTWRAYAPGRVAHPTPLVMVLHGSNGDGEEMMEWSSYGFSIAAEEHGFIAVYPDGYKRYWNDCRRDAGYPANREGIDDVGFLGAVADEMIRFHELGDVEVFVVGVSNGGHMAYRLAYEAPDFVDGIAAVVASVPAEGNLACRQAAVPVATLILNGTDDPINPYEGGIVNVFGDTSRGEVLSADASARYWAGLAGYEGPGRVEEWPDRDPGDGTTVVATTWSEPGKLPVTLLVIRGGGHALPHPSSRFPRLLGRTSREFDAAEVIWSFFAEARSAPRE